MAPAAPAPPLLLPALLVSVLLLAGNPSPGPCAAAGVPWPLRTEAEEPDGGAEGLLSILSYDSFGHDYSPPSPPPPAPPNPPSSSCEGDLRGAGSFDTLCQLSADLELSDDLYIEGKGSFVIFPGVVLSCALPGCAIVINLAGELRLGNMSALVAGRVDVHATNASLVEGSIVNTTALAGDPPPQTSGTPTGIHGDGGGHGGRGASCYTREGQSPDDSWGGDAYSWSSLMEPESYGSKGGSTSREKDYGGGGGGRIRFNMTDTLEVNGVILSDGGEGGLKGGGGSGGSIFLISSKMTGREVARSVLQVAMVMVEVEADEFLCMFTVGMMIQKSMSMSQKGPVMSPMRFVGRRKKFEEEKIGQLTVHWEEEDDHSKSVPLTELGWVEFVMGWEDMRSCVFIARFLCPRWGSGSLRCGGVTSLPSSGGTEAGKLAFSSASVVIVGRDGGGCVPEAYGQYRGDFHRDEMALLRWVLEVEVNKGILTTLPEEDPDPDYSSRPSRFSGRGRDRDSREISRDSRGRSVGCENNNGAAGTLYDAVPRSLVVDNYNFSTQTDTLLLEFPYQPLWTNVVVRNCAKVVVPLLWSRVQVQGQLSLFQGSVLSFGLKRYPYSEFELMAEELLMSDSIIRVNGALRMSVKMLLMWNSRMLINGGGDTIVATSLLEASNLIVLKESSLIHSNANLGVHGQGRLNLSGSGDVIEAQRLILSLFYSIEVGPGSVLRGPLENATKHEMAPRLNCDVEDCPIELLHPPEDCNVNSSLSFTLQICRVEDIAVAGLIQGNVIHFHRARSIVVQPSGTISASGLGCRGGVGKGKMLGNGVGGGGGHGGKGGNGFYNGSYVDGGIAYGSAYLPCELGSGSGDDSLGASTAGGGIIVMGSLEHSLASLSVYGSIKADGESLGAAAGKDVGRLTINGGGIGGGSGGTILLFLHTLMLYDSSLLSSVGGYGSRSGGGGGGGGRIHFHWSNIATGDEYLPIATVDGDINTSCSLFYHPMVPILLQGCVCSSLLIRGGLGQGQGFAGENGTITGKDCPKGLYGIFCEQCPLGTFKNVTGSDGALCRPCPSYELPRRAIYISVRGTSCYSLLLSVARMKFVNTDELPGPAPTQHGSQIDHSFPFLESLNELLHVQVLETNRVEESQSHVHRMYFMGPNTFSEPWHLPHSPPPQLSEIVYEDAYNRFVDEVNALAAYPWWEGSVYSILSILAYPLAWSWQQWRRRKKFQRLREFVRSEYDHSCLRSCRSRALYEGLKVASTADLMLAYVDFFLGGDEKRPDLPPRLQKRLPMCLIFGGDGSYMAPFFLHSDNVLTSLMSQAVPPTIWYRLVAGLNAHLRLVRRGRLKLTFLPVIDWLETHANPALSMHGVCIDLAWFQATTAGYRQFGLVVDAAVSRISTVDGTAISMKVEQPSRMHNACRDGPSGHLRDNESVVAHKRINGGILNSCTLRVLEDRRDILYPCSLMVHNTKPVGHQDLVGLVISILLLGDFSLVLLTLLQLYSFSLGDVFLVLFVLPLGILSPFPAGINALFSHGPRRSAGIARVYALWNITSMINVVVAFLCGFMHYRSLNRKHPNFQPWNTDESGWWLFPTALVFCKCIQARLIDWHVANLEIQDRSLYSKDQNIFWQS
ncbi:hypothetical protein Taro_045709 [Colocasia esculenta]|uniref:DUF8003 domain-containing protein n=1 Tax=Colocasia esculenta TaxID=4460 RepID=A0A843X6S0_COLES|nr:hypothetical protein [Colocasia esculenta]